jgi:response regulator RpfG family c-di-GMP phosphodiesterase
MHAHTRPAELRLAELVAALSLGIDLGFGQPMEHVLRQCLIALRLAEQVGLDEQSRADVYYTALLINVGCHSDAHEQAKWFGDDIVMKSRKYAPEFAGGVRTALAAMGSIGAGNPPLHRFRIGLEFLISGHRDVDHMIDSHAKLAQSLAQQLGLPQAVLDAVAASYERWNGQGWPRGLSGAAIPIAARIAQFAEFVEVAHRMGGTAAVNALARERGGKQFDPALAALFCDRSEQIFGRATTLTRLAAGRRP